MRELQFEGIVSDRSHNPSDDDGDRADKCQPAVFWERRINQTCCAPGQDTHIRPLAGEGLKKATADPNNEHCLVWHHHCGAAVRPIPDPSRNATIKGGGERDGESNHENNRGDRRHIQKRGGRLVQADKKAIFTAASAAAKATDYLAELQAAKITEAAA